ncbi:MAG: hypothetical protein HQK91_09510 [Nitrospirae bacterium]|nr:hypothetical protein [Nitrospirota bacterium]
MKNLQCPYLYTLANVYLTCDYTFKFIEPSYKGLFCDRPDGYKECCYYLNIECLASINNELQNTQP